MSDLSRDVRKSFSANEHYYFFLHIKDLKTVVVMYLFYSKFYKVDNCFWGVVYMRDETGQKSGSGC